MARIVPHLWFDEEAKEAAAFYTDVFPGSRITQTAQLRGTPSGDCDVVAFELRGQPFMAISAGPLFKFNPSISFFVNFDPSREADAAKNLDTLWARLSEGGTELMPLQEYPWSKRYGWVQDRYGLTWQLILTNPEGEPRPDLIPSLMFVGKRHGHAEEAIRHYLSVFQGSPLDPAQDGTRLGNLAPSPEGTVLFADFRLLDTWFAATDSPGDHPFDFNEAISLMVLCDDQAQIDYYWSRLSAVPEAEQCGWLKDRYGVSWQIASARMQTMMATGDQAAVDRLTQAFLPMKKLDLPVLQRAFQGG